MRLSEFKSILDRICEKIDTEKVCPKVKIGDGYYDIVGIDQFDKDSNPIFFIDVKSKQ